MKTTAYQSGWKTWVAFAIIYIVWGATFLAIRIGVNEVPPLLFAAMRFFTAGALLGGWMLARGEGLPKGRQWGSVCLVALLIFVFDYGLLFWAEQRIPSGVAAVMMAITPAFTAILEIIFLRTQRLTGRLALALAIGLVGVAVLMSHSANFSGAAIDRAGAAGLICAALSWSVATVLMRRLPMPVSKGISSAAQMLIGGAMLGCAAAGFGELRGFSRGHVSSEAWLALAYLVVFGSIIGFTAYIWLIHHESPTKVGTYAYVNPVVAVLLGYFIAGEALGLRTVLGTLCVLVSVVVITTSRAKPAV